ncbi:MAG: hypothetical protein LAT51_07890 [Flavobacteriaceae bacterium]|nr:hypothetical protein [Flavobacteriaceae bacterium]
MKKYLILTLLTICLLISCNTTVTNEMSDFEKAVITNFQTYDSYIVLTLKKNNGEVFESILYSKEFENFKQISQSLKKNNTIEFKGEINERKKGVFNKKESYPPKYIIIDEIRFLN